MEKKPEMSKIQKFDKEYFPCAKEWWCAEGFLTNIENNKKWSFKTGLYQAHGRDKTTWSVFSISIFDLKKNKTYYYHSSNDSAKLESERDSFYIKYEKSYIKGSFPNYKMYFLDPNNNIKLDIKYHAESLPHWIAQQITDGWLPWGLGYYRYGFIPKNEIKGNINIDNKKFLISGKGYFEHIWGDFSFYYLFAYRRSIKKTISTYAKLIGNWIHSQEIKIPESIIFSTDNRPPGYDWIWVLLDNGWSIFFGNMILWITEGPATGILILSKDGIKYNEFSNIHFKYNKMKYLKKYDFYYPNELEIIAKKGQEKLYLHIKNISDSYEGINETTDEKSILGFTICEIPSMLDGYYFNGKKKSAIKGISKLEIHRLLKVSGHNSLKLNFELSNNSIGILSSFNSHYFGKKIDFNLHLLPKPNFKFKFLKINKKTENK